MAHLFRAQGREQVHDPRNDARPTSLVAGPQAGPIVAVEILVEQQAVAPVRVFLEFPAPAVDGTPAKRVLQEDGRRAAVAISSATW